MRRAAVLALLLACGPGAVESPPPGASAGAAPAAGPAQPPATPRASIVLEPPRIEIGDVFTVELAVVTPPEHRVAPAPVPKAVAGIAIVDAPLPSLEQQPGRWVHRQRFRARARSTGALLWPALEVTVAAPDGSEQVLRTEARPFVVVSLLEEHPERRSPFGFRSPRVGAEPGPGAWFGALLGSLVTLAALGLVTLVRRVRMSRAAPDEPALAAGPGDLASAQALAALHAAEVEPDPVHAADLASQALRSWAADRFEAPLLRWATTEEIAARPPPFLLHTRHAALVAVLEALDALRFPPLPSGALGAALARARAFVLDARGRAG